MLVQISPENLEVANMYLQTTSIQKCAEALHLPERQVAEILDAKDVKRYIDNIYLDLGYRNKFKLGALLDKIIESKLEEAEESGIYSTKDLIDIIKLSHDMRMQELKAHKDSVEIKQQTNVQINETPFGSGNYGKLMEKLLNAK